MVTEPQSSKIGFIVIESIISTGKLSIVESIISTVITILRVRGRDREVLTGNVRTARESSLTLPRVVSRDSTEALEGKMVIQYEPHILICLVRGRQHYDSHVQQGQNVGHLYDVVNEHIDIGARRSQTRELLGIGIILIHDPESGINPAERMKPGSEIGVALESGMHIERTRGRPRSIIDVEPSNLSLFNNPTIAIVILRNRDSTIAELTRVGSDSASTVSRRHGTTTVPGELTNRMVSREVIDKGPHALLPESSLRMSFHPSVIGKSTVIETLIEILEGRARTHAVSPMLSRGRILTRTESRSTRAVEEPVEDGAESVSMTSMEQDRVEYIPRIDGSLTTFITDLGYVGRKTS